MTTFVQVLCATAHVSHYDIAATSTPGEPMNVATAIAQFVSGHFAVTAHSAKTRAAYTCDLAQFRNFTGTDAPLASLDAQLVERWAADLTCRSYLPASVRRKMAALRVFCAYWVRRGNLARSPFWQLRLALRAPLLLPRVLTTTEVRLLLRSAKNLANSHPSASRFRAGAAFAAYRNLAIVELLLATGVRVGELAALRAGDVCTAERSLVIHGKGARQRLAFVVDSTGLSVLKRYIKYRAAIGADAAGCTALLINPQLRALSSQGVARALQKVAKHAGLAKHITPHMLRHTSATLLLENGADLRVVQEFLGHSSIVMTQRYTHVSRQHLCETLERCHPRSAL